MEITETLYVISRKDWRKWLIKNYKNKKDIWLIYYRKKSGKPRISYGSAVEEALCYGWIDSIIKGVDDQCYAQRFSPRRSNSVLSQINRERVRLLVAKKKMTKVGLAALAHVYNPKKDVPKLVIPIDALKALKNNKDVWKNFQKFPEAYKRIRIAYLESRRNQGVLEYERSLQHFIKMTEQNKRIGSFKEWNWN